MASPENPTVRCSGVIADEELVPQLERLLATSGFSFESFAEPAHFLRELDRQWPDFVILDPGSLAAADRPAPGLPEFVEEARRIRPGLPILVLLPPEPDEDLKGRVLDAGVTDFLSLPLSVSEFTLRVRSLARTAISHKRYWNTSLVHEGEIRVTIGEIMLREAEALYVLGKAAEYKDRETGMHIARVAHYSQLIARVLGETPLNQDALFHASALHDIGKLGIPDAVLGKPGKFTNEEFVIMKTHAVIGYNILKDSQSSYLLTGALIALTHHEKFDGTGYPMRLKGEEIPLFGRIVGIADVFDALTTVRPYKEPWPLAKAFAFLAAERRRQFDPTLVDAFLCNSVGVEAIYYNHADARALTDGR